MPADVNRISLRGAAVVSAPDASPTEQLAARELARYLYLLTGNASPVVHERPERGAAIILSTEAEEAGRLGADVSQESVGNEGFHLRAGRQGQLSYVAVAAMKPVGVLYGVYGLLEELGMGFYLGGDTFPERKDSAEAGVPANLDLVQKPVFAVRGNMLHYNFLVGCTTWGLQDYQFYFDQLARMRCNMLLMHWYDGEPGAAYEVDGEYLAGGPAANTLSKSWGALAALRTSQFSFGTGAYFDEEIFGSPPAETAPDVLAEIKQFEHLFSEATRYARRAGIGVAAGFEAPRGDPTNREVEQNFVERIRQFLERNPHISHFALWQHESGGVVGTHPPEAGTSADKLFRQQLDCFSYLGSHWRVWEAIRFGRFAQIAYELLRREAPHLRLVMVGWGGDRWMHFADYCLVYDKLLPDDVVFTCHENCDATFCRSVSTPWGRLPPERERWAIPWVEGDINECWTRQPNVETLGLLAPDALRKGCQGLLTLHWRTRDVEEEAAFAARFAWDPSLTPDRFYQIMARHAFGPDQQEPMAKRIGTLQRLGARWTGVHGSSECGGMRWTSWVPHIPFEVNGAAALHMRGFALKARDTLAEVPADDIQHPDAGMFHKRDETATGTGAGVDMSRPGVQEFEAAAAQLERLSREEEPARIQRGMREVEESIWRIRPKLVHFGIPGKAFRAMDEFLIRIHHLARYGSVEAHFAILERLRNELSELRQMYLEQGRVHRLERLDYLLATMDFAVHYDRVAMLCASDEAIDRALAQAAAARQRGDDAGAALLAASAYEQLLQADMQEALLALTRKLTTRCDFAVLATVNVKAMPLYWETIGKLEGFLAAAPPRELTARSDGENVWLTWEPSSGAAGYNLYRRQEGKTDWERVNRKQLLASTHMFVDRPGEEGRYEYALAAIDEKSQQSPLSHTATASCGAGEPPRILACKPASVLQAARPLAVRVVAVGEREIAQVRLLYRSDPVAQWTAAPMLRRFRNSYHAVIPSEAIRPGMLLYFVEACDEAGQTSLWPATARQGLPWAATVVSPGTF